MPDMALPSLLYANDDSLLAGPLPAPMVEEHAKRIARAALVLQQREARIKKKIIRPEHMIPWEGRHEEQREAMAMAVIRVVQAMHLLGYFGE